MAEERPAAPAPNPDAPQESVPIVRRKKKKKGMGKLTFFFWLLLLALGTSCSGYGYGYAPQRNLGRPPVVLDNYPKDSLLRPAVVGVLPGAGVLRPECG